jgi:streptogramin lyase
VLRPVLAVALIASCAAPVAPPSSAPTASEPASTTASTTAAVSDSPAPTDAGTQLADRLEAAIEVAGSPDWPTAAFGSVWVLAPDLPLVDPTKTPYLARIDPATNEVMATIPVPDRLCQGFVASEDSIWVCAADALVRIDPATNAITSSVPITGAQAFYRPAFGGGTVWALGSTAFIGDTVIRLDPATEATTTYPMSGAVGGLAYGFDALWLTIPGDGAVVRLDPVTGEHAVVASGLASPRVIAIGSDSLWVGLHAGQDDQAGQGDPQVVRIDPTSGEVLAEFEIGGSPQFGVDLWAGEGGVLVRSTTPWLTRIDEASNEVVESITSETATQGPVTTGFGSIWTVDLERDTLFRIAP